MLFKKTNKDTETGQSLSRSLYVQKQSYNVKYKF